MEGAFGFFWPYPENSIMTDEAVEGLVGQTFKLNELDGSSCQAVITRATNNPHGGGVHLMVRRLPKLTSRKPPEG